MKKVVKLTSLLVLLSAMVVGCGPKDNPSDQPSIVEPSTGEPTGDSTPVPGPGDSSPVPGDSSPVPVEKTLESIEMDNYPSSDPVKSVDDVDLSSVTIKLVYSDGSSEIIPVTKDMITWSDVVDGVATATVEYEGKTTSFVVNIEEEIVKTDLVYHFTIDNGAVFQYDGSQAAPDIRVVVESPNAEYEWYFAKDEGTTNLGKVVPTEAGTYTIEIHMTGSKYYNDVNAFRWFQIVHKQTPTIEFTFEAGQEFAYDGTGEKPNIDAVVLEEGVECNKYFVDVNDTNLGTEIPTEPGRYTLVCETIENEQYVSSRKWCSFVITAPGLLDPVVTFGETVKFPYDGNPHTPTVSVSPDTLNYTVHYEQDEKFYSNDAPSAVGWYAMVVVVEAGNGYNGATKWVVFEIQAAKAQPTVEFTFDAGQEFAYDGTGEKPNIDAIVLEEGVVCNKYFVDVNDKNLGTEIPTEPGTYTLVCETVENEQYAALRIWRWFVIKEPGLIDPVITFGTEVEFTFDGNPHTPTVTVSPEGINYTVHYEKNEQFYSNDAPTEAGVYAMIVEIEAGNGYNAAKKWVIFSIVAETPLEAANSVSLKNIFPR